MDATLSNIVGPTMLDDCWSTCSNDATISQQLLAVQLVQNSVRK